MYRKSPARIAKVFVDGVATTVEFPEVEVFDCDTCQQEAVATEEEARRLGWREVDHGLECPSCAAREKELDEGGESNVGGGGLTEILSRSMIQPRGDAEAKQFRAAQLTARLQKEFLQNNRAWFQEELAKTGGRPTVGLIRRFNELQAAYIESRRIEEESKDERV